MGQRQAGETQDSDGADGLDDFDLLLADRLNDVVELGLFRDHGASSGRAGSINRFRRGYAEPVHVCLEQHQQFPHELVLERFGEFCVVQ